MNSHIRQPFAFILIVAVIAWWSPVRLEAQVVDCRLSATGDGSFAGECATDGSGHRMELRRPDGLTDALWVGTVEGAARPQRIEIATYQYADGPKVIVRSRAWHLASRYAVSGNGLRLSWDEGSEAPPSAADLEIVEAAKAVLSSEAVWDREDDRNCENDKGVVSLYCALARATAEVMGRYQHRQPAMQAVRRVIATEWPERVIDHRLMSFNNDPRTSLGDVERLFDLAADSIRNQIQ